MSFLDNLPLASLITIAGLVGAIIALANGTVDFEQFMISIGALSGGAGVVGIARAQSGKSSSWRRSTSGSASSSPPTNQSHGRLNLLRYERLGFGRGVRSFSPSSSRMFVR